MQWRVSSRTCAMPSSRSRRGEGSVIRDVKILVYDGDCGLCERTAAFARRRAPTVVVRDHRTHGLDAIEAVSLVDGERECTGAAAV